MFYRRKSFVGRPVTWRGVVLSKAILAIVRGMSRPDVTRRQVARLAILYTLLILTVVVNIYYG